MMGIKVLVDTHFGDREANCIRSMLNFARGGVTTWDALRKKMRADGWTDEESMAALIEIDPKIDANENTKKESSDG